MKKNILDLMNLKEVLSKHEPPNSVFFELNYRCNLRCKQCDIWKNSNPHVNAEEQFKQARRNVLILKKWLGNFTLNLMMGEPFLFKGILEFIKFCNDEGVSISLNTNGTTVNERNSQQIVKSGLKAISFSLDGIKSKTHDKTRGVKGTHKRVKEAILAISKEKKICKSKFPTIYINTIIMDTTIPEIIELIRWVKESNIDGISLQPIAAKEAFMGTEDKPDWFKTHPLWPKDLKETKRVLKEVNKMSRKKFPIVPNKTEVNNFIEYFSDPIAYSGTHMCAATKTLTVKLNGDTYLCGGKLKIGNIHTTDPEKLWNGSKARVARVQIMNCRKSCRILALNRGRLKTVGN